MALSRVGGSSAAATSIAIPAHQVGDIIVIWAYRDGNTTPPTKPTAGGTVPAWVTIDGPTGANSNSAICAYFVATATTTTSGTWTNATGMSVEVWRGADTGSASPIGGHAQGGGSAASGANMSVPAITPTDPSGNSVYLQFAGHQNVTAWSAAPSGYTQRSNVATECEALSKDSTTSDGAVNVTCTASASGGYRTQQIEILALLGNRVSQEAVEALYTTTAAKSRASQEAVEILVGIPTAGNRASQLAVEILYFPPIHVGFISSATTVYTPTLQGYVSVPFISSVTALYAINLNLQVPFIASSTSVHAPTLQGYVSVPFIGSSTAVYTPTVSHVSDEVDVPFISSVTSAYTPSLIGYVSIPFISSVTAVYAPTLSLETIIAPSGVVVLTADAPTVYPIQLFFADQVGVILIQSAGAEISHVTAVTSGVITLKSDGAELNPTSVPSGVILLTADPPAVSGSYAPPSGVILVKADPPLPLGAVKPPSGVLKLTAEAPTVIPYSASSGSITLKASAPANIYPVQTAGGRITLSSGAPPYTTPTSVPSGVLALKADSATMAHATVILNQSGIIRLRSDTSIVTPLTEPPPNPPPLEGTGIRLSGTVG